MIKPPRETGSPSLLQHVCRVARNQVVPIMFAVICVLGVYFADMSLPFLGREVTFRMARNSFLVISLVVPVVAGLGLNFGIVLGAMAGQMAVIAVIHWGIPGVNGFLMAVLLSTPLAIMFGYLVGLVLNRAKGKEMIAGMIMGFFANGIYLLIFMFLIGPIIPMNNTEMVLSSGVGIRNSVDLRPIRYALDNIIKINIDIIPIPIFTFTVIALLSLFVWFLQKTKLGQDFRSVGNNMHIAEIAGINVDKTRIRAIIISTVLAAWGQLIFLQNIGTLNTYGAHEQVGLFAVAAILIGGATVAKATIGQALLGTFLFHTLFIISPLAGQNLLGNPQVGEYFRVFVAYGVIGIALALHAWKLVKRKL